MMIFLWPSKHCI